MALSREGESAMADAKTVVVAQVGAAHGIRGEVRLKSFTAVATDVAEYGPLTAPDGRTFEIVTARPAGASPDMLIVRFKGVDDRTAARALTNLKLSVPLARLPPAEEDEFYHADLIGLSAVTPEGEPLGVVVAVDNHGAGDILEIAPARGPSLLVPFSRAVVPEVDLHQKRIVVDPPVLVGEDETEGEPGDGA